MMTARRRDDTLSLHAPPRWPLDVPVTREALTAAFDVARPFTIGVEEELMLVDPATLELTPAVDDVLPLVAGDRRFTHELRLAQLEIVTDVCDSAAEACRALADARRTLVERLEGTVRLIAAGTHPLSTDWGPITPAARYEVIGDEYTWAARRSLACGLHVHVAIGPADCALAVYNALRSFLPELGAVAANSPFFEGEDTGLCSVRPKLNEAFPRAGVPPAFRTWDDLAGFLGWARRGGLFPDTSHFWWDMRLHPSHGTIELRVADAQTRAEDSAAVAALFQALAGWLADRWDAGDPLPVHQTYRVRENAWRALRYGVRGWLVDLDTGTPVPARERLAELIELLEPYAARLGSADELLHLRTLLAGNGADRQRYVAEERGMDALLEWLADETESV